MKRIMIILMAASLFTASIPGLALAHGDSHEPDDVQCARECEMLLKNCAQDVDTLQQRISKLSAAIKKDGADQQELQVLKGLKQKLAEAKATLRSLEKPGR